MNKQHVYLEKQLGSLKKASEPRKDELDRLEELRKIESTEQEEINRLTQGSKQIKEKVAKDKFCCHSFSLISAHNYAYCSRSSVAF